MEAASPSFRMRTLLSRLVVLHLLLIKELLAQVFIELKADLILEKGVLNAFLSLRQRNLRFDRVRDIYQS